ncbi:MAG TPA: DUF4272 domain-containing protein [Burkholderiaceae bacterium]|jgi:hypothetical protein
MNPEFRKLASETLLHKRGIRINLQLPEIESNEEIQLRSADELFRRLVALWAVSGSSQMRDATYFRDYIVHHKMKSWLSDREREFLFGDARTDEDYTQFSCKREALFFLAWCADLIKEIEIPSSESSIKLIMTLFPQEMEAPSRLQAAIRMRSKDAMLDWADLLYRVHWAVRHATLINKPVPANLDVVAVQEWHQAVNWMIRYDDEDNWDCVGTDT